MPDDFLLNYTSFNEENKPFVDYQVGDEIIRKSIFDEELALKFDFSKKFCTGWVDFEKRCSLACPESASIDSKYESCLKCRDRTGFNPAFYNANSISAQQKKINAKPHFVYLAYFAPNVIKVGISQESRGLRRILEQGSRMALKLETFPSALIARQYEAKISELPAMNESISQSKKMDLLKLNFDENNAKQELINIQNKIEHLLKIQFKLATLVETTKFFQTENIDFSKIIDMSHQPKIIGQVIAAVGSVVLVKYNSEILAYNLKRYIGYQAKNLTHDKVKLDLPEQQMTLF